MENPKISIYNYFSLNLKKNSTSPLNPKMISTSYKNLNTEEREKLNKDYEAFI